MWSSLPRSVREREGNKRVDALRRRAEQVTTQTATPSGSPRPPGAGVAGAGSNGSSAGEGGPDAATIIAVALAGLFVVCAVIGLVTLLGWLVPG